MRCSKCDSEIHNVPEHLKNIARWICKECSDIKEHPEIKKSSGHVVTKESLERKRPKKLA